MNIEYIYIYILERKSENLCLKDKVIERMIEQPIGKFERMFNHALLETCLNGQVQMRMFV